MKTNKINVVLSLNKTVVSDFSNKYAIDNKNSAECFVPIGCPISNQGPGGSGVGCARKTTGGGQTLNDTGLLSWHSWCC